MELRNPGDKPCLNIAEKVLSKFIITLGKLAFEKQANRIKHCRESCYRKGSPIKRQNNWWLVCKPYPELSLQQGDCDSQAWMKYVTVMDTI